MHRLLGKSLAHPALRLRHGPLARTPEPPWSGAGRPRLRRAPDVPGRPSSGGLSSRCQIWNDPIEADGPAGSISTPASRCPNSSCITHSAVNARTAAVASNAATSAADVNTARWTSMDPSWSTGTVRGCFLPSRSISPRNTLVSPSIAVNSSCCEPCRTTTSRSAWFGGPCRANSRSGRARAHVGPAGFTCTQPTLESSRAVCRARTPGRASDCGASDPSPWPARNRASSPWSVNTPIAGTSRAPRKPRRAGDAASEPVTSTSNSPARQPRSTSIIDRWSGLFANCTTASAARPLRTSPPGDDAVQTRPSFARSTTSASGPGVDVNTTCTAPSSEANSPSVRSVAYSTSGTAPRAPGADA